MTMAFFAQIQLDMIATLTDFHIEFLKKKKIKHKNKTEDFPPDPPPSVCVFV